MIAADLVIRWDDRPIFAEQIDPTRDFRVGNADARGTVDFEVGEGALASSFPLVLGRRGSQHVAVLVPDGVDHTVSEGVDAEPHALGQRLLLPLGAEVQLHIGMLELCLRAVASERRQRREWPMLTARLAMSLVIAAALIVGLGTMCRLAPPETRDDMGLTDSQRYLIQHYLESAAEREQEQVAELWSGGTDGATGSRHGVAGPLEPHIARAAALRDAAAFGMIGMLNSGAGGGQGGDVAPWGSPKERSAPDELSTWKRSRLVPHSSKLMVGDEESLPLQEMQARVTVDGFRARVVLDYVFFNPHLHRLEGRFKLRLPDGASPYFLAFGETSVEVANAPDTRPALHRATSDPAAIMTEREPIWNEPREARMVPREKARRAFDDTVRRQVDPALLEWAGAGVFTARVFPIEPRLRYRVVVGYDADLTAVGSDLLERFDVPEGIPHVSVQLDVADVDGARAVVTPAVEPTHAAGRDIYAFASPAWEKGGSIELRLKGAPNIALTHRDASGDSYFAATFEPILPATPVHGSKQAVLLVDTSLSSNPDAYRVWLAMLEALLEKNRDSLQHFAVLFFDVEAHWWRNGFSDNTDTNVTALLKYAETLALEGATDLGLALREGVKPSWLSQPGVHDVFLLSDGSATWGDGNAFAISKAFEGHQGALFAYRTGLAGGDVEMLEHLSREARGAVFAVTGEDQVSQAAVAHRQRPWEIVRAGISGADDVMLAGRPTAVFPGQRLVMVGRAAVAPGAAVALAVRQPGAAVHELRIPLGAVVASPLAERAYGYIAVRQLEALDGAAGDLARAYALHFRIPGDSASLLMLESEADYLRHGIEPQQDHKTVRREPAAKAVASALRAVADELGDPKAMFMRSLAKLEELPEVNLRLDAATLRMIEALAPDAFIVPRASLAARGHDAASLPAAFARQLASHSIDYDDVTTVADSRRQHLGAASALVTLSSLIELNPGDAVLQRDVGYSAMDWGMPAQAFALFNRVAAARPDEPESYRAMARALLKMKRTDLAMAYFEIGLADAWKDRFPELGTIVAMDYLALLQRVSRGELAVSNPRYAGQRLASLSAKMRDQQADVVVMISWNTNDSDVDLHVVEPSGEECFYEHPNTAAGGSLTRDVTTGFGPEMYRLPSAPSGRYRIQAKYYTPPRNQLSARTKVHAVVIEGFGTPWQRTHETTVSLHQAKDVHEIAELVIHQRRVTMLTN